MSACGRKALTLLSSVFAVCGLGLLGIAVSTDYWLYLEEGVVLPQNQSTEVKMSLHSGLWRVCFLAGEERGRCFTIEYVMPVNTQMTSESTVNVLKMIRSATPFPLVSLFFMFIGFILSNIGHIRPHRTILAFVSGIFFILSGNLCRFRSWPSSPYAIAITSPRFSVPARHECSWLGRDSVSAFLHERQIQSAFGRTASSLFSLSHPPGTLDCPLHFLVTPQTFDTDLPSGTDLRLYLALRSFFYFFVYLLIYSWPLSGLILGAGVTAYKRALSQAI
uniref:Calcium voltage-gated channel auxiliary subunit gamma 5 n=1 Tax=Sus scrofa TaxID=9823 RepID=A0A8D1TR26_PIG